MWVWMVCVLVSFGEWVDDGMNDTIQGRCDGDDNMCWVYVRVCVGVWCVCACVLALYWYDIFWYEAVMCWCGCGGWVGWGCNFCCSFDCFGRDWNLSELLCFWLHCMGIINKGHVGNVAVLIRTKSLCTMWLLGVAIVSVAPILNIPTSTNFFPCLDTNWFLIINPNILTSWWKVPKFSDKCQHWPFSFPLQRTSELPSYAYPRPKYDQMTHG